MVRSRERQIEIVANGLPLWHGAQLAIDATLVAPLSRNGAARPRADQVAGATIAHATRKKRHQTYPELLRASQCRLVVFALETGGRWGDEALDLLRRLARAKAREAPPWLRASAAQGWANHWSGRGQWLTHIMLGRGHPTPPRMGPGSHPWLHKYPIRADLAPKRGAS